MKLIFAFYNVDFAKQIKGNMEGNGEAQILDIVSSEEDLINTIAKNPMVEGVLISTDIATKMGNSNLELFVDILLAAREKFPEIIFSVLSSERIGHPIHAEIVEMGIYNIFVKGSDNFTIPLLLNSFVEPFSFSSAMRHRKVDETIPWRRNLNKQQTIRIEIGDEAGSEETNEIVEITENKQLDNEREKKRSWPEFKLREKITPTINNNRTSESITEWFEDNTKLAENNSIIGTVVIALGSVAPHLGTTHTSISIASALKQKGHVVALVEGNASLDYDRIHALYEGESKPILSESNFDMNGIAHYKYRGEESLQELFALYEYLILDLGNIALTDYENEFRRAHVRGILCSGHEWKFHWIEEFRKRYFDQKDIFYLVPHGAKNVVNDLQERLKDVQVLSIPTHPDPYKPSKEAVEFTEHLLAGFLKGFGKRFSKGTLIVTSGISVALTIVIIGSFLLL